MIYIHEAHTTRWPIGYDMHPAPHCSFEDRCQRALQFVADEHVPYPVYVDGWDNAFCSTFHAWPDRFMLLDAQYLLLQTSEYEIDGAQDGKIQEDCVQVLQGLLPE